MRHLASPALCSPLFSGGARSSFARALLVVGLVGLACGLGGCETSQRAGSEGAPPPSSSTSASPDARCERPAEAVDIERALEEPERFDGRHVRVRGHVVTRKGSAPPGLVRQWARGELGQKRPEGERRCLYTQWLVVEPSRTALGERIDLKPVGGARARLRCEGSSSCEEGAPVRCPLEEGERELDGILEYDEDFYLVSLELCSR